MSAEHESTALGAEMLQEIGRMNPREMARDASGCRNLRRARPRHPRRRAHGPFERHSPPA
jgi:hypothetical protein